MLGTDSAFEIAPSTVDVANLPKDLVFRNIMASRLAQTTVKLSMYEDLEVSIDEVLRVLAAESGPSNWSLDGRNLVVSATRGGDFNVAVLEPGTGLPPVMIAETQARELWGVLSPEGGFIAYGSTESGADQVYVQPFPPTGERWQVSVEAGAEEPRWTADGEDLVYRSGRRWISVSRREGAAVPWTRPRVVREGDFINVPGRSWDTTNDGTRYLFLREEEVLPSASTVNFLLNWLQLLGKP